MQKLTQQLKEELRSAWRFRWYAVAAAWCIGILGLGVVAWLPNIYEATARVYVDAASDLRPLLTDRIVAPDVTTHLAYVRQALRSRDYLERVAAENGLDSAAVGTAGREKLLQKLAESIVIDAAPVDRNVRSGLSNIFTISYRNQYPETAVGVVSTLLDSLIEDTLGANRQNEDMAGRFLEERIAEYEARLEQAEQARAEFQRANSHRLPGTEGNYFERIQLQQEAIAQIHRELRLAESRRQRLQQQLTREAPLMTEDSALSREPAPGSLDARIQNYRAELDRLLLEYTERHPEVIALRESLRRLEDQRAEQLRELGLANSDQQLSALGANPVYQALQIAVNEVDVEIATLEADLRDRERGLKDLRALVDEVPGVEAELARLNRDYDVIYDQYQAVIKSRETQQLSQQASATDQVEFRVLNPPRAGIEPVAPPRLLLLAGALVAAIAGGAGLSYLLAQMRPVITSVRALNELSGRPVIGSVSGFVDPLLAARRRAETLSLSMATVGLVFLIGAAALFELIGAGIHSLIGGAG
jgi:polysaccharide chain length determinant protein (PEP-CTERM system associated)